MNENLRDAHLHLAGHGEALARPDLSRATTLDAALAIVEEACAQTPPDRWVFANGLRPQSLADRRFPTAQEIAARAPGRHVVINSFDHHASAVSPRVLDAIGITDDTPDPEGGVIQRDAEGRATGVLVETAHHLIGPAKPAIDDAQYLTHVRLAQDDLTARGYTEVHDMMATPRFAGALLDLEARGELTLRVRMYAVADVFEDLERIMRERCGGRTSASGRVSLAGLKIFTDGTLNLRTAAMLEPYTDPDPAYPTGTLLMPPQRIREAMHRAFTKRYEVAAHAIGDRAVRAVLDAYTALGAPPLDVGSRPALRIEHAQFIHADDIPRFARTNVAASLQPCHLLADIEAIRRHTPDRADRAFPLRDLIDGAHSAERDPAELILLGSDTPVVPPDPEDNRRAAVERRRAGMDPSEAVGASQAITEDEWRTLQRARTTSEPIG